MEYQKLKIKNCAPLTDCTSEISNIKIDHAKGIHAKDIH